MPEHYPNVSLEFICQQMARVWHEGARSAEVQTLANTIVASHPQNRLRAIFDWTKEHLKYVPDPRGFELVVHPWLQAYNANGVIEGDCDDAAVLNAALLEALGYEARILIVDSDGDREFDHALAEVKVSGVWLSFDTVKDDSIGARVYSGARVVT